MKTEQDLGTCCICTTPTGVRNVIMLPNKAEVLGHGWGCFVCNLPADGASAVLCDPCLTLYQAGEFALVCVCRGYPAIDGRIPYDRLDPTSHTHDQNAHKEWERSQPRYDESAPVC